MYFFPTIIIIIICTGISIIPAIIITEPIEVFSSIRIIINVNKKFIIPGIKVNIIIINRDLNTDISFTSTSFSYIDFNIFIYLPLSFTLYKLICIFFSSLIISEVL